DSHKTGPADNAGGLPHFSFRLFLPLVPPIESPPLRLNSPLHLSADLSIAPRWFGRAQFAPQRHPSNRVCSSPTKSHRPMWSLSGGLRCAQSPPLCAHFLRPSGRPRASVRSPVP